MNSKKIFLFCIIFILALPLFSQSYLKYARVKTAYNEKSEFLDSLISSKGIKNRQLNLLILGYKQERELVIYCKKASDSS